MKKLIAVLLLTICASAQQSGVRFEAHKSGPLAHTFSIVARDPATGEMGVAVQSHWFAVGSEVSWARAGVGAVATQSFIDPSYGPKGLDLMEQGVGSFQALTTLLNKDQARNVRQISFIDSKGDVTTWTGGMDIQAAGQNVGRKGLQRLEERQPAFKRWKT